MSVGQLGTTAREWAIGAVGASRLPKSCRAAQQGRQLFGHGGGADAAFSSATCSITPNIGAGTTVGQVSCTLHPHGLFAGPRFRPPSAHLLARH